MNHFLKRGLRKLQTLNKASESRNRIQKGMPAESPQRREWTDEIYRLRHRTALKGPGTDIGASKPERCAASGHAITKTNLGFRKESRRAPTFSLLQVLARLPCSSSFRSCANTPHASSLCRLFVQVLQASHQHNRIEPATRGFFLP